MSREEPIRQIRAALGADVGLPIPSDSEALELFAGLVEQLEAYEKALRQIKDNAHIRNIWHVAETALGETSTPAKERRQDRR